MIKKLTIVTLATILFISAFVINVSAYDCGLNGHKFNYYDFVEPTCTTQGYQISICTYCHYKIFTNYVPSLGHSFINGTCSTCGEKDTSHTHSYVATVIKNATCTSNGIKKYQCSDTTCGDSYTVTIYATGHKLDYLDFVEPTCTTQGYEISVCKYCDYETYSYYVEPLGHDYNELSCSRCGYQREIDCSVEGHKFDYYDFVEPTCTTQGYQISICQYCGYEIYSNYVDALKHSYLYVVIIQPTCDTVGAEQMQCECGAKGDTRTIAKLNHNYELGECTNCGKLEGQETSIPGFPNVDFTKYSFVMDDLNKDSEFNTSKYPATASEHTINVFQVAESSSGELFLYVYNPTTNGIKLDASFINMSTEIYESKNPTYKFYSLTKLSESGQFTKYLVNNFKVKKTTTRYYNIVGIYTPFNAEIHEPAKQSDDIKNYVGVPVAKCFEAITKSGAVTYACKAIDYVDAEIIATGTVRYADGFFINHANFTDSHFVAFNVNNFDVKKIFDIDIRYMSNSHEDIYDIYKGHSVTEGPSTESIITVHDWEKGNNEGGGFLGSSFMSYHYKWDRISTLAEFEKDIEDAANEDLIGFNKTDLSGAQFVIRFLETNYTSFSADGYSKTQSTRVTETTILRMHFATPEGVYNLGVVADVVSDDGEPDFIVTPGDNAQNTVEDLVGDFFGDDFETLETLLAIIFVFALVIVIMFLITYFKTHSLTNAYASIIKTFNRNSKSYRKNRRSYGNKSYKYKKGNKKYVQKQKGKTRVQARYKKRT